MFKGTLADEASWQGLPQPIKRALQFLKYTNLQSLAEREIEIEGRDLFVQIQHRYTLTEHDSKMEAHDQYIDIHHVIEGSESIGYIPRSQAGQMIIDELQEKDICFFPPSPDRTLLVNKDSSFMVFYPCDAHQPCLAFVAIHPLKKAVVKISMNLLSEEERKTI
ncbi:Toxin-antitoxin biofilm protein TabA [bioreactor metagenome]|uniref:Toxin-antitoxin biofilm protein TabA n=1 Tax=bioreactor metagenome TaxID=1076179 RepID=A0A645GL42_9ZZZZ|nr:YhcH/YjgK/YiaL family protein [Sphaerochaeta associata]MEA5029339.1 YhcH/YjgK/YiaL family protein [Sphaerochaeta associata]